MFWIIGITFYGLWENTGSLFDCEKLELDDNTVNYDDISFGETDIQIRATRISKTILGVRDRLLKTIKTRNIINYTVLYCQYAAVLLVCV